MPHRTLPAQCIYVPRVVPTPTVIISVTEALEMYVACEVTSRCTFSDSLTWTLSAAHLHAATQLDAMHSKESSFGAMMMCHGVGDNRRFEWPCVTGYLITNVSNRAVTGFLTTDVSKDTVSRGL
jgi:hypothetical protein